MPPKENRDPAFVQRKLERLEEPHVAPLTAFVKTLNGQRGIGSVPWFDPDDAGIDARILLLFEAPGPRATGTAGPRAAARGSGFISPDNDDRSAEAMWRLFNEARIERHRDVVNWNIVPWYVGDDRRIRAVEDSDLDEARPALLKLLTLLPQLRIIVLLGDKAIRGWLRAQIPFPILAAPHPSPRSLAGRPHRRQEILHALTTASAVATRRPAYGIDEPSDPL